MNKIATSSGFVPSNLGGFVPSNLGGFNLGQPIVSGPPISFVGLTPNPQHRDDCLVSFQRAILVKIADLGTHILLGCVRDTEADVDETGVTFGLGTVAEALALENNLQRRLTEIFASGRVLESVSYCARNGGARCLVWLDEVRLDRTAKRLPPQDLSCLAPQVRYGLLQQAEQARARREAILALRQRWSLGEATFKSDLPKWVGANKHALKIVLDSAAWQRLPESAESATQPAAPRTRK